MDITKLKNNWEYYDDSYYVPDEITISIKEEPEFNIHIEEGYLYDIIRGNAPMDGKGWYGFTRDYLERVGGWEDVSEIEDIDEYLNDLMKYLQAGFSYKESPNVLNLIIDFLTYAKETGQTVVVEVN